ncbi:MAG: hypothetical protein HC802_09825, partial [Caldilineaceae bacterium]|nr:hypothetical protein [Caldilineaceae bacterium]
MAIQPAPRPLRVAQSPPLNQPGHRLPPTFSTPFAPAFVLSSATWLVQLYRLALLGLLLVGLGLRLWLLTAFPLREDEAIYSVWALHILHGDRCSVSTWPDKPPTLL